MRLVLVLLTAAVAARSTRVRPPPQHLSRAGKIRRATSPTQSFEPVGSDGVEVSVVQYVPQTVET